MLLGEIGAGANGSIQRIALSPDDKYVVALALLNPDGTHEEHDRETDVRVYELETGNLQARFRYPGILQDLGFSPDGKYLAMVGSPQRAYPPRAVLYFTIRHGLCRDLRSTSSCRVDAFSRVRRG